MTDKERDAAAASGAGSAIDDDAAGADEPDETDEFEDDDEDKEAEEAGAAQPSRIGSAAPAAAPGRRLRGQPTTVPAPTVSERAVRVDDRFSSWYVIAVLGVFALILANAVLFGHSGFVTGLVATPTPIATQSPVASAPPSIAPSESAVPSAVPSSPAASPVPSSSVSAAPASSAPASAPAAS